MSRVALVVESVECDHDREGHCPGWLATSSLSRISGQQSAVAATVDAELPPTCAVMRVRASCSEWRTHLPCAATRSLSA